MEQAFRPQVGKVLPEFVSCIPDHRYHVKPSQGATYSVDYEVTPCEVRLLVAVF